MLERRSDRTMARRPERPARTRPRATSATRWLVTVMVLLLLPVPWLHVSDDDPPGTAWKLDGRLVVDGEVMDPPGRWSWLTVGRPPMLAEVAGDWLVGGGSHTRDMRDAPAANRPSYNEPTAAAVGLAHAGTPVHFEVLVEAFSPVADRYPARAVLLRIGGVDLTDRASWKRAQEQLDGPIVLWTEEHGILTYAGPGLPYRHVNVLDVSHGVDAAIAGDLSKVPPVSWFRDLALGRSHGMMVALVTYAHTSGEDLAQGRHVAGTGGILSDGSVTRIGGLPAKAAAARDRGADVLLFPAEQLPQLQDFERGDMHLIPIETLDDAITALRR